MHARTFAPLFAAGLIGSLVTLTVDRMAISRAGAQEVPAVVQAQRFELVGADGTPRGVFGVTDNGPTLELIDPSGQVRLALDQTVDGYGINIMDASGVVRFGVGTTAREGGFVGLNVRDKTGAIRSRIFASDDGKQTGFQVQDPGPKLRAEIGLDDVDHRAVVQVRDTTGVIVWQAP